MMTSSMRASTRTTSGAPRAFVVQSRRARIAYWACTILLALFMLQGGIEDIMRTDSALEVMKFLGYPAYFATLLGVAKVLGAIAILAPVPRMLREWAYAGFTFDIVAAIVSLIAVGAVNWTLIIPVIALAIVQGSYWLWRARAVVPHQGVVSA